MKSKVNKLDYSGKSIYVGLDTHLKDWKVTIKVEDDFYKSFSQNPDALVLTNYLRKNFPNGNYFSAYEASFSGFNAHRELIANGVKNIVVNPADIPTSDKERAQKEDRRDSRKICHELSKSGLTAIYVPDEKNQADRSLLRLRRTYGKELGRSKNRVKSFLHFYGISIPPNFSSNSYWSNNFIKWLKEIDFKFSSAKFSLQELVEEIEYYRKKQLKVLRQLRALSKEEKYKNDVDLLISIPGIGLLTAMKILTEIIDMKRFKTNNELCSFVGLIPRTNSSGEKDRIGNITKRNNSVLREAIVESSWIAIRNDPALMLSYQEFKKRMSGQKAIIRIAKKMLSRIRFVLNYKQKYETSVVK